MSLLGERLREMIASDGPMPVERFMALANGHPTLGYYASRDPLGAAGDFITAPEISQMFGELLGLWSAEAWRACGSPTPIGLVELGPGRGTMMADALRALQVAPDFLGKVRVHLVESSGTLRATQRETLTKAPCPVAWHDTLEGVPAEPAVVLANEFFDALPVRQFVRGADGWHERLVGTDAEGHFVWGAAPGLEEGLPDAPEGAILEIGALARSVMREWSTRIVEHGGVLLVVDYGHTRTSLGETLQAVRRHGFADPLREPGEADLTAHVDFAALARAARAAGAEVRGPVTQAAFLRQLGIRQRAAALRGRATPAESDRIATALNRLTAEEKPTDMGRLFKAMAVVRPGTPPLAGFVPEGER